MNCFNEIDNNCFVFNYTLKSVLVSMQTIILLKDFLDMQMIKYMYIYVKSIISVCILIDTLVINKKIRLATRISYLNTND